MIVFDLKCAHGHVFEAWFASSGAWEEQRARGLVACPVCGDSQVAKAVMAPNVATKGNRKSAPAPVAMANEPKTVDGDMKKMIAALSEMQAKVLKDSTWVGRDFDRQARAIDAGEMDYKSIYGEVTPEEAKALKEDGIAAMPLPLPVVPPDKRN